MRAFSWLSYYTSITEKISHVLSLAFLANFTSLYIEIDCGRVYSESGATAKGSAVSSGNNSLSVEGGADISENVGTP